MKLIDKRATLQKLDELRRKAKNDKAAEHIWIAMQLVAKMPVVKEARDGSD